LKVRSLLLTGVLSSLGFCLPAAALAQAAPLTLSQAVSSALAHDPGVQQNAAALTLAVNNLAKQKGLTYPTLSGQLESQLQKSSNYNTFAVIGATPQNVFSQNTAQVISSQYLLNSGGLNFIQLGETKAQLAAAKATLQRSQDQIANSVTAGFYLIAQKNALVLIDQSDLHYQTILRENAQAKERAGVAAGVDVLRAQAAESKSLSTLVADQAAVKDAKESLAQQIGASLDTDFAVPQVIPQPVLPQGTVVSLVAIAEKERPDVASAAFNVHNAELIRKGWDRELFPQVQLNGSFGNQFSPTTAVLEQEQINMQFAQTNLLLISQGLPPIPLSQRQVVPRGSPGFWQIQALTTFTLPFVDYGARRTEKVNDDEQLASARASLANVQGQAALDVHESYRSAQTALAQEQYAHEESRLGIEAARIAQLQYKNGIATLTDVTQAQQTSVSAQGDLVNAQVGYVVAVVRLRIAIGIYDAQSAVADLK
jgi:outer membrane protein